MAEKRYNISKLIFEKEYFEELLKKAVLSYIYDTSWAYKIETQNLIIDFYQDESGKNIIEQFCVKIKNVWVELQVLEWQIKLMFQKLDNTPFKEVEPESFAYPILNYYDYYGVAQKDFY